MELGERVKDILENELGHWDECEVEGKCECGIDKAVQAIVKIVKDEYGHMLKSDGDMINEYIEKNKVLRKEIARLQKALEKIVATSGNSFPSVVRMRDIAKSALK